MKWRVTIVPLALLPVVLGAWRLPMLGLALRGGFVLASAAPIGAVLLLAIGRLTGFDAAPASAAARALPVLAVAGAVAMLGATGVPLPPQLAIWGAPWFVALRAAVFTAALAFAGARLAAGASRTFAGVTLALYAAVITPIGADWLLPSAPGHPVSAVGMMLCVMQVAAAAALGAWRGTGRVRRDHAGLLVAALLGLWYLAFMDYLIVWYGDLPDRVPFYLARPGWLAGLGAVLGIGGAIGAAAAGRLGWAAGAGLTSLAVFALWWLGAGVLAALALFAAALFLIVLGIAFVVRAAAHG